MKYTLWIVAALILRSTASATQTANPAPSRVQSNDPFHRETPQSCVYNFQQACHASDYTRATKYLDLRSLPQSQRLTEGRELARQLCEILDRDTQFEVAELSNQPEGDPAQGANRTFVDSFDENGKKEELDLERITLRSHLAIWVFSADAVAHIPELARMTLASPIEKHLPAPLVNWTFLDTSLWRWLALLLLVLALAALSRLFSRVVLRLLEPALKRVMPRVNLRTLASLVSPLQLLLAVAIFRAGMEAIEPSQRLAKVLDRLVSLLFFLAIAWFCARIVDAGIGRLRVALQSRRHSFSYSVLPLASRVVKIAILLLTIAAVLSSWGYNTTSILAGMGIGGIAVALAAQKTIENLFGGVAVISDRPVTVGDFCKFGDRMGTVEDIGLRSTRIRTPDRTLVTVPNGLFSAMTLENFDQRDKMLFHFMLNLRRDTKPGQVRALLASIAKILADHPKIESGALPVRFVGVGTYSLDVEVFAYVLTRDGDDFLKIQQDLYLLILDAVEAAGTSLALPTQASIAYTLEGSALPNGAGRAGEAAPRAARS